MENLNLNIYCDVNECDVKIENDKIPHITIGIKNCESVESKYIL